MNLLDLLAGNTQPGGLAGQVLGQQTPTGLGALLQSAQSPGAMALQPAAPPPQPAPQHHGLFGGGTRGTIAGIAGIIGDALSAGAGRQPTFAPMLAQRQQQDYEQQLDEQKTQREEAVRRAHRQVLGLGDGGVAAYSDDGGFEMLRQPTPDAPHDPTAVAILRAAGVDPTSPEGKQALIRSLSGFQYSPEGIQARVQGASSIADAQGAARARYRAPPAGGGAASGGTGRFGHTKSNPYPVNSRSELESAPRGTWVSLPNGQVTQRR